MTNRAGHEVLWKPAKEREACCVRRVPRKMEGKLPERIRSNGEMNNRLTDWRKRPFLLLKEIPWHLCFGHQEVGFKERVPDRHIFADNQGLVCLKASVCLKFPEHERAEALHAAVSVLHPNPS